MLDSEYGSQHVNIFAHSMGNIVVSEALRIEATSPNPKKLVHAYVASQAAVAADAYDPTTSRFHDSYSYFAPGTAQPQYFASIGSVADHLVNFFNPVDYATSSLTTWWTDQQTKPDGYTINYARQPDGSNEISGYTVTKTGRVLNLAFPPDRYEAFSFAAAPTSLPLGATPNVGGPFLTSAEVDLNNLVSRFGAAVGADFTQNQWDHSAQFNGTNMQRKYYWNLLMKAFGFAPWDATQTNYPVLP